MKALLKNKIFYILLSAMLLSIVFCGFSLNTSYKAFAAEIDYVNQNYSNLPSGFDYQDEGVIYKIHCPDVRAQLGIGAEEEYETEDFFTTVSFKAAMGCQIYFVNGIPCNLEDSYYGDYKTTMYSDYYDILHYDDTNKNVYIKLKNISQLSYPEDVCIMSGDKVNPAQYIYISNIEEPVTEVTSEDIFFSTEVVAAHGGKGWTEYNIYSIEYTLKLNQRVAHLVSKIDVSFVKGGENFTLYKSSFVNSDGVGENSYNNFTIMTLGDISDITERVKLQAVVTYGDKTITVESAETDLITLWTSLVNNNFSGYDYETYMTESNKTHIKKLVASYNAGFFAEVKGSQNYFADYNKNTDIKLTSLIFKIPMENFNYASFSWTTSYWQGYVYTISVRIDSSFRLSATAYRMRTNEDGTVTVDVGDIEHNESVGQTVYNSVDFFAYDNSLYLRIKDDSPVNTYFSQRADRSFSASATNKSYSSITMQANTATIIYDDYNNELLAQIATLNEQLKELQRLLETANALSESQKEQINVLQSLLDGLEVENSNLESELAYINEQIDVMREEYQKKIDQLIADNEGKEPTQDKDKEPTETEQTNLNAKQIIGICSGVVLLVLIVILLIPKRRRN